MRPRFVSLVALLAFAGAACTEETSTPLDLGATTTSAPPVTALPDLPEDDPNADARNQVIELAKEECRKDPSREFGVVIIADANGDEVNRYEHPCSDVDVDADTDAGVNGDE